MKHREVTVTQTHSSNLSAKDLKTSLTKDSLSNDYSLPEVLKIQKFIRGVLVRQRLHKISEAASKIQSFYRSKQTQFRYKNLLLSVNRIQRSVRRYLCKSHQIHSNLSFFLPPEDSRRSNLQLLEHSELFSSVSKSESSHSEEAFKTLSAITESSARHQNQKLMSSGSLAMQVKQVSAFHLEKASFFARPFEFELLVDDSLIYEPFWARQFESLNKELISKEEQIIDLAVGSCHSFALTSKGRAFAWGWNDKFQCGSEYSPDRAKQVKSGGSEKQEKSLKFVQVTCGNDHSLLLTSTGSVLALGDNSKGQLGLGHYSEQKTPCFIELPPCKQVEAVGNQNMAVSTDGQLFIWPFETFHGEKRSYPIQMLPEHVVAEVAVGFNFAVVLTSAGLLFSLGSNNRAGQLGHGDLAARHAPTLILSLKKSGEKVAAVSCGHQHVVARTTLGKVFTWGSGCFGQLGHGGSENELLPRLVQLNVGKSEKTRPVQISAGFSFSVIMIENRKILWTGKTSSTTSSVFQEVHLSSRLPELFKSSGEFAVVKVKSVWSRILSLALVVVVDLRYLQTVPQHKLNTGLNLMASRWTGKSNESIEGMFLRCINR